MTVSDDGFIVLETLLKILVKVFKMDASRVTLSVFVRVSV
jgi:hypothetical protein